MKLFGAGERSGNSRRGLRTAVAALALLSAGCATTFNGGGVVANRCVPMKADYDLKTGDKLTVGVGDLSTKSGGAVDVLNVELDANRLKIGPSSSDEVTHPERLIELSPDGLRQAFTENGSRMTFDLSLGDVNAPATLHIVKTCPQPKPYS